MHKTTADRLLKAVKGNLTHPLNEIEAIQASLCVEPHYFVVACLYVVLPPICCWSGPFPYPLELHSGHHHPSPLST